MGCSKAGTQTDGPACELAPGRDAVWLLQQSSGDINVLQLDQTQRKHVHDEERKVQQLARDASLWQQEEVHTGIPQGLCKTP